MKPKKADDSQTDGVKRVSTTDPDSGFLMREGKPRGFFYLDHRTVDAKYNIITDTFVTAGNVSDSDPYLERLQVQKEKFNFSVEAVALDSGYFTGHICKHLHEQGIFMVMGYRRFGRKKDILPKRKFHYIKELDAYACPMGCKLTYRTTDREGYRHYKPTREDCAHCPLLAECTKSKQELREITRHIWEEFKEIARANKRTQVGKSLYKARSYTVERSFGDSKELHNFRYARMRGVKSVQEQAYLTAACQNMKKIALHLAQKASRKAIFHKLIKSKLEKNIIFYI